MPKENQNNDNKHNAKIDLNDVEMVFGTPNSPKRDTGHDVHTVANEKKPKDEQKTHKNAKDREPDSPQANQPLLEHERERPKPPLAGPEIDDLDDEKPADATPYPGIDDGLLDVGEKKSEGTDSDDTHKVNGVADPEHPDHHDDGVNTDDGKWLMHGTDEPDFYYGDGFGNGLHSRFGDDRPGSPMVPGSIPDVNTYQQKKNLAQGMMDLALLSANANQLRYVIESASSHPYYYPSLVFITCSIVLQIAVGIGLIMNSRYNVKDEKDICKADKINNMTVLGVFLITIVNVFITSFSVASPSTTAALQNAG